MTGYLTFRGFVVDHVPDVAEARAMLGQVPYRGVVAAFDLGFDDPDPLVALIDDAHREAERPRTVALVQSSPSRIVRWPEADLVLGADLPIMHLGAVLCASLLG
ncbi:MAG: hypothetical protein IT361_03520 [Gemmatimonadaceae bacterium]|nr:hypothetical protein [Gemmatimonadaceae bacterium]